MQPDTQAEHDEAWQMPALQQLLPGGMGGLAWFWRRDSHGIANLGQQARGDKLTEPCSLP